MATHTAEKVACAATVWQSYGMKGRLATCSRSASIVRDGKHYCKQHDPEVIAAKAGARKAARDAEWAEKSRVSRLNAAAPDLLDLAHQYRDDLRHPPTADSITRRLAAIDAVLAKVNGE